MTQPEKLVDVFLNGFASGAASAAKTLGGTDEAADTLSAALIDSMRADPCVMDMVRTEIKETLLGTDSGPKNIDINTETLKGTANGK